MVNSTHTIQTCIFYTYEKNSTRRTEMNHQAKFSMGDGYTWNDYLWDRERDVVVPLVLGGYYSVRGNQSKWADRR